MAYFVFDYVIVGGPMTLSFICLEWYIAVVHPTSYPLLKRYRCREVCALSVWLLVLPIATLGLISDELRRLNQNGNRHIPEPPLGPHGGCDALVQRRHSEGAQEIGARRR